jgi:hypothetical protein
MSLGKRIELYPILRETIRKLSLSHAVLNLSLQISRANDVGASGLSTAPAPVGR